MGDRCHLVITLYGTIKTKRAFLKLIDTLTGEDFSDPPTDDDYLSYLLGAAVSKHPPQFNIYECNYADIDNLEAGLQDIGVSYAVYHGAGDSYGPGRWSVIDGQRSEAPCDYDGNAVVSVDELKAAAKETDPDTFRAAILDIISTAEVIEGATMPPFELAPDVKRAVAARVGGEALRRKAA